MQEPTYTSSGAEFSEGELYRYHLHREWNPSRGRVLWVMLNPSTADASVLDPTLRRCLGFTLAWGYGRFDVVNLFALRSPYPEALRNVPDPVGPVNNLYISAAAHHADLIVSAWGVHGSLFGRDVDVLRFLKRYPVVSLGRTQNGSPRHPLYVKSDTRMCGFSSPGEKCLT
jgi:hypothetical protein